MTPESRSQAIAAAVILLFVGVTIYFLPVLVLWVGSYSPALGFVAGALILSGFFVIFWLRARHQSRK